MPHSSSSWCQSAELRASREHSRPSAIALPRRSYWRTADSVLLMTCLRVDWRIYSRAVLARWAAVTFEDGVSVSTGAPSPPGGGRDQGEEGGDGPVRCRLARRRARPGRG